ncbi:MAG: MFS transporter [Nocardioides sp.]|uniref:MFS transporter n=1 Tax=Nocardioides sp. TaxID=35761 RepID=UPI0039E5BFF9
MQRTVSHAPGHWVTFSVLAVSVLAFTLLQSLVIPVLGEFRSAFRTDQATVTWVLTAYLLAASICTPLIGRLGDAIGKRKALVLTLVALSLGSLMAASAGSIAWLIAARVAQGAGGGVLPLSFGIIRDEFPRAKMQLGLSIAASLSAAGFGIGIVLAGPIVDLLGFRWLFWLPMITTGIAAFAALLVVPESPVRSPGRIPVAPAVLLSMWLAALLLAVSQGNHWGWGSARVVCLLAIACAAAVGWVVVELHVQVPLIDMQMMRSRGIWTSNVVSAFFGSGVFAAFGFLPQFLETPSRAGYGFDATIGEAGRILLPSTIFSVLVGLTTANLVRTFGSRAVVMAGTFSMAVAFASIAMWHDTPWHLAGAMALQGIGSGLVGPSVAGVVIVSVPPEQTGTASGINANVRTIGGAIGSAVMAGMVTAHPGIEGYPTERGYVVGFLILAAGMLLATAAAWAIPRVLVPPRSLTRKQRVETL